MNLYREVLDNIPTAAIVVDKNMKVRYTNRAFRECFRATRSKGTLKETTGCTSDEVCGKGVRCAYCAIRSLFSDAVRNDGRAFRKLIVRGGEGDISFRIRVTPLGKLYLGIVDDAYETEIAREMYSAQDIQQRLLPPARSSAATHYSFMYIPCREIGGDLPDVYEVNGETMGLLADVSGKGISAGMLSAFVKAGWDRSEPSPSKALRGLNAKFQELHLDERSYVTAVAVRVDNARREIVYSTRSSCIPRPSPTGSPILRTKIASSAMRKGISLRSSRTASPRARTLRASSSV